MSRRAVPVVLTVAGSDPSGGAGLQADLKTFHQHRVYGGAVVTLLTVQTTERVSRVQVLEADLVREQLQEVLADLRPAAVKAGALGSAEVVRAIAPVLLREAHGAPLVIDPVMISKHGHALLDGDAIDACVEELFPIAALLTPNIPEAERLLSHPHPVRIVSREDAEEAALSLARRFGVPVLVKGGHLAGESVDVLALGGEIRRFSAPRIDTPHTHGTGCTYSAAITARLARGEPLPAAIERAKRWLTRAIANGPEVGRGIGPVDHLTPLED